MSEPSIVMCEAGAVRCVAVSPPAAVPRIIAAPPPERVMKVQATLDEARALLEPAGLWAGAPLLVLDARMEGPVALTVIDAASEGFTAFAGRPAILFAEGLGGETDLDVVLHELTHVWMRSRGASEARWRLEDGRANHQSAVVHEGLADFVAAALTHDPMLSAGEKAMPRSLRVVARCPDDLTGHAHVDSLLIANALWELGGAGQRPSTMSDVVGIVAQSAVDGSRGIDAFVSAVSHGLVDRPALASRWEAIIVERGLRKCQAPIDVGARPGKGEAGSGARRVSARKDSFLAAGEQRFGLDDVVGPLQFTSDINGFYGVRIVARSSQSDALAIAWRVDDANGEVLARGRAPLVGWPSQYATLSLPPSSHRLTFGFSNSAAHDITYNDVGVAPIETHAVSTSVVTPPSGCGLLLFGAADVVVPLMVAWTLWRRRRSAPASPATNG